MNRYYLNKKKFCNNCKSYGDHTQVFCCQEPKNICFYCGDFHLNLNNCPKIICSNCGDNHLNTKCTFKISEIKCNICQSFGHLEKFCSNNWRLYYNITDTSNTKKIQLPIFKPNKICFNCSSKTHMVFNCPVLKNSLHKFNPLPNLKEESVTKILENPNHIQIIDENFNSMNNLNNDSKDSSVKKLIKKKLKIKKPKKSQKNKLKKIAINKNIKAQLNKKLEKELRKKCSKNTIRKKKVPFKLKDKKSKNNFKTYKNKKFNK